MTDDERDVIFTRLQELQTVNIDHVLERGKDYLLERLTECRRRQDECGQIAVRVKRAMFDARIARRSASSAAKLSRKPGDAAIHLQNENAYDEMKALDESVGVTRGALKAADSDIRLAATLLGVQVYLGQPSSAPSSDTATPMVQTPEEVPGISTTTAEVSFDELFGDAPAVVHPAMPGVRPPRTAPAMPAGKPPSATILTDPDTVVDLDSLLS